MPLLHKYFQTDFQNGFETHNTILDTVPYEPEVIFIGTYNHGWSWNQSDFFYGRGMYMWTILGNLFLHNENHLIKKRIPNNNIPNHEQIFEICQKGRFIFADIVKGVRYSIPAVENIQQKYVLVNNQYYWCTREIKGKKVGEYSDTHLDNMGNNQWLDDNVEEIVKYINNTPSIKHIYFTFKSGTWVVQKMYEISNNLRSDVSHCSIFTPTANGFGVNLNAPFHERSWSLAHCWVWNGLVHNYPIDKPGYEHLDHSWLIGKGVNPNNF
jgi:hypothetical protein